MHDQMTSKLSISMPYFKVAHKKEVDKLKLDKQASDEALNCATNENTKLKDKETTLLDIFKSMNQFMNEKLEIF